MCEFLFHFQAQVHAIRILVDISEEMHSLILCRSTPENYSFGLKTNIKMVFVKNKKNYTKIIWKFAIYLKLDFIQRFNLFLIFVQKNLILAFYVGKLRTVLLNF